MDEPLDGRCGTLRSHGFERRWRWNAICFVSIIWTLLNGGCDGQSDDGLPPLYDPEVYVEFGSMSNGIDSGSGKEGFKQNKWIVVFKPDSDEGAVERFCLEAEGIGNQARRFGGTCEKIVTDRSALGGSFAVFEPFSWEDLEHLRVHLKQEISYIERDMFAVSGASSVIAQNFPSSDMYWGLDRVDQQQLPLDRWFRSYQTGKGVHIYVLDSGVRATHKEFVGRVYGGSDFVDDDDDPSDEYGHGTHISGIAAGSTYGVAKEAIIHPIRVLGPDGAGAWSGIIRGIGWVLQNHEKPAVATLSLGGSRSVSVNTAVEAMVAANITVVVASGNSDADACMFSPASVPHVITVGSTNESDERSSFSNWGTCVDIFAPGEKIVSAWHRSDNDKMTSSGTSMSCPYVVGAAALILENEPTATPDEVLEKLIEGASKDVLHKETIKESPNYLLNVQRVQCTDVKDCVMGPWSAWSLCPARTCGYRERTRSRRVWSHPQCGGMECGPLVEIDACDPGPPCPEGAQATEEINGAFQYEWNKITFMPVFDNAYSPCSTKMTRFADNPFELWSASAGMLLLNGRDRSIVDLKAQGLPGFPFYGTEYTRFWVGADGFLTFHSKDDGTAFPGDMNNHFKYPRISALYTDLKPNLDNQGRVFWNVLPSHSDPQRVVVTWHRLKDYCNFVYCSGSNTFQVILHLQGDRRGEIELNYGEISHMSRPIVVGLSSGDASSESVFPVNFGDLSNKCLIAPVGGGAEVVASENEG